MSLRRAFDVTHKIALLFEVDAFNVTNTVVFGGIQQDIDSTNFEQVSQPPQSGPSLDGCYHATIAIDTAP